MLVLSELDIQCVNIQFGIREGRFAALVGFLLPFVHWRFSLSRVSLMISKTRTKMTDTDKILPVTECEA